MPDATLARRRGRAAPPSQVSSSVATFEHEALLYEGMEGFLAEAVPFIREGLRAGEPVMVAVGADKIARLREELGDDAQRVRFEDMARLGRNPGRIIPAWRQFLAARPPDRGIRGIGEPIWAGRSTDELVECQLHESLLNIAFDGAEDFRLLCPYDTAGLDPAVVHEARCSHPIVAEHHVRGPSHEYRGLEDVLTPFEAPLPKPPASAEILGFDREALDEVRRVVLAAAARAGLTADRASDAVLATNEVAANAVRHGGGQGILRTWLQDDELVCEVRDRGLIADPLVGRSTPQPAQSSGWGVWIAHQVCDLVQLRSSPQGTVVRLRMRTG